MSCENTNRALEAVQQGVPAEVVERAVTPSTLVSDTDVAEVSVSQDEKLFPFDPEADDIDAEINKALSNHQPGVDAELDLKMSKIKEMIKNMSGEELLAAARKPRIKRNIAGSKSSPAELAKKKAIAKRKKKLAKKNNRR